MEKKHKIQFTFIVTWEMLKTFSGLLKIHKLELVEKQREVEDIETFVMRPSKKLHFKAGQYGIWFVPRFILGKPARLFTIAVAPTEDTIQISTRIRRTDFKKKLSRLPLGSSVYMIGPLGEFVLPTPAPEQILLIAGGIGVTPMRAIARYVHDKNIPTKLTLIHSADHYLYRTEFEKLVPDSHFVARSNFEDELQKMLKSVKKVTPVYISGPPAFVLSTEVILRKNGIKTIVKDGFLGY